MVGCSLGSASAVLVELVRRSTRAARDMTGKRRSGMSKWIGVDFDGTLADTETGAPIPAMIERVKRWLEKGIEVRIVTARLQQPFPNGDSDSKYGGSHDEAVELIMDWCEKHIGVALTVQWGKSRGMIEFWDDKAVAVQQDTGLQLSPSRIGDE